MKTRYEVWLPGITNPCVVYASMASDAARELARQYANTFLVRDTTTGIVTKWDVRRSVEVVYVVRER